MSDKLQKARTYEKEKLQGYENTEMERPIYHVTPAVGWMNDPNGFSEYRGEYHLFYQYHPYSLRWGPMHWGHIKTKDFVRWERLPVALAPDTEYDCEGCFSGSAIETEDGRHLLVYTGVSPEADGKQLSANGKNGQGDAEESEQDNRRRNVQRQCVAVGDGVNYEKYVKNPVIDSSELPKGASRYDFRDPKVWKEDGIWWMVVSNMYNAFADGEEEGAALLYKSSDGYSWEYVTVLAHSDSRHGAVWECPDFFPLGAKRILIVSAIAMEKDIGEFHNGNNAFGIIGNYDKENCRFVKDWAQSLDYGIDFYAPQTILSSDGRRILIGWMQSWETCSYAPDNAKWYGQMTFPRELSLRDGRIIQVPVREIENYHANTVIYRNYDVGGLASISAVEGRVADMTVKLRPKEGRMYDEFEITIADDGYHCVRITYCPRKNIVIMDRSHCGIRSDIVCRREIAVGGRKGYITLRILLDIYSAELFINDGEQVATMTFYTPKEARGITFLSRDAVMDLEFHEICVR